MGGKRNQDLTGQKFNRLTALYRTSSSPQSLWMCKCECGTEKVLAANTIKTGAAKSCGCLHTENMIARNTSHGKSLSEEYYIWCAMKRRCNDSTLEQYHRYGGRGISLCERWLSFESFISDMGNRPTPKHTIDRKNNDGNYEPNNCRWATWEEQQNNRSSNVRVTIDGKTLNVTQWCKEYKISRDTVLVRIRRGWDPIMAVQTPTGFLRKTGKIRNK